MSSPYRPDKGFSSVLWHRPEPLRVQSRTERPFPGDQEWGRGHHLQWLGVQWPCTEGRRVSSLPTQGAAVNYQSLSERDSWHHCQYPSITLAKRDGEKNSSTTVTYTEIPGRQRISDLVARQKINSKTQTHPQKHLLYRVSANTRKNPRLQYSRHRQPVEAGKFCPQRGQLGAKDPCLDPFAGVSDEHIEIIHDIMRKIKSGMFIGFHPQNLFTRC